MPEKPTSDHSLFGQNTATTEVDLELKGNLQQILNQS
jgi:hypothetical protein